MYPKSCDIPYHNHVYGNVDFHMQGIWRDSFGALQQKIIEDT